VTTKSIIPLAVAGTLRLFLHVQQAGLSAAYGDADAAQFGRLRESAAIRRAARIRTQVAPINGQQHVLLE
jgi:hypothetical protein